MNNSLFFHSLKLYLISSIRQAEDLLHEGNFSDKGKYSEECLKGSLMALEEILHLIDSYKKD